MQPTAVTSPRMIAYPCVPIWRVNGKEMLMTINQYVDKFGIENLDEIWVKDAKGNYTTANGNTTFRKVEMDNSKYPSLTFTI